MFFCDECAEKRNYPTGIGKSQGACELCLGVRMCNDIASKFLPLPVKSKQSPLPHVDDVFDAFLHFYILPKLCENPNNKSQMLREKLEDMGIYLDYRERK